MDVFAREELHAPFIPSFCLRIAQILYLVDVNLIRCYLDRLQWSTPS